MKFLLGSNSIHRMKSECFKESVEHLLVEFFGVTMNFWWILGREALRKPKSSSVITNHHLCCSWTWNHADAFTLSNPQHPALRFVLFLLINTWHSSKTEKKARNAIKGFDQIQLQPSTVSAVLFFCGKHLV